jgi:hypothetical protein
MRLRLSALLCSILLLTLPWLARAPLDAQSRGAAPAPAPATTRLPNQAGSLKMAVLGDFGTGDKRQYELAAQMVKKHATFPFELVILVGDNLYGSERPQDFQKKFEVPYKPLLDAGVKFYASLGNHDSREQRYYKLFNMDGHLYYSFKAPHQSVRFFALESTYPVPELEDSVLSSSALLVGRAPRIGYEAARRARAAVPRARRQHGLHRPRPFLRAGQTPEGHSVFRRGLRRTTARRQHRSRQRPDRCGARHRQCVSGR